jgi:hypothetical protein
MKLIEKNKLTNLYQTLEDRICKEKQITIPISLLIDLVKQSILTHKLSDKLRLLESKNKKYPNKDILKSVLSK